MRTTEIASADLELLHALAEFRHRLRQFLHFSESAAERHGLQAQQHQLLLQIAGAQGDAQVTVGYLAGRLGLRHNSVVELCNRCEEAGLLVRRHDDADRRCVLLELTAKGRRLLAALSIDHACELTEQAPQLIRNLGGIQRIYAHHSGHSSKRDA